jgi:hypothetical protein
MAWTGTHLSQILRVAALAVALSAVALAAPANVAGSWQFTVQLSMGTASPVVTFKQDGETITGTYEGRYGQSSREGHVKENAIECAVTIRAQGTAVVGVFTGTYADGKMSGEVEYEEAGEGTWSAVRMPPKK